MQNQLTNMLAPDTILAILEDLSWKDNLNFAASAKKLFNQYPYPWDKQLLRLYGIQIQNSENAKIAGIALYLYEKYFKKSNNAVAQQANTNIYKDKTIALLNHLNKAGEIWAGIYLNKTNTLSYNNMIPPQVSYLNLKKALVYYEKYKDISPSEPRQKLSDALLGFSAEYAIFVENLPNPSHLEQISALVKNQPTDSAKKVYLNTLELIVKTANMKLKNSSDLSSFREIDDLKYCCQFIITASLKHSLASAGTIAATLKTFSTAVVRHHANDNNTKREYAALFRETSNAYVEHTNYYNDQRENLTKNSNNITQVDYEAIATPFNIIRDIFCETTSLCNKIKASCPQIATSKELTDFFANIKTQQQIVLNYRSIALDVYFFICFIINIPKFNQVALEILTKLTNAGDNVAQEKLFKIGASYSR